MNLPHHIVAVTGLVTDTAGNVLLVEESRIGTDFSAPELPHQAAHPLPERQS